MKHKIYFITFIVLTALLSCSVLKDKSNSKMLFELETTSCYGTCPVYKLQIFDDGIAKLEGKEHLDKIGNYIGKIDQENLDQLKESFESVDFFNLENSYTSKFLDLPTKYITYYKDGKSKQIMAYDNVPKDLMDLIKQLQNLVKELDWKETE